MKKSFLPFALVLLFVQQLLAHETADAAPHVHLYDYLSSTYMVIAALVAVTLYVSATLVSKSLKRKAAHA